jgi:hypothetical protein
MNPFTGGWADGTKPKKKKNLGAIIGGAVSFGARISLTRRSAVESEACCSLVSPSSSGAATARLRVPRSA